MGLNRSIGLGNLKRGQQVVCRIKTSIKIYGGYFVEVEGLDVGAYLDSTNIFERNQTVQAYFVGTVNRIALLSEHKMVPDNFTRPDDPFDPMDPSQVPRNPYPMLGAMSVALPEPDVQVD